MALYQDGSAYGQPVSSDVMYFETDLAYTRETKTFGSGSAGALEIGAADARLTVTAIESGTAGNYTTISVVNPNSADNILSVNVTYGTSPTATGQINIVVTPATNGSGVITSTANEIRNAINDARWVTGIDAVVDNADGTLVAGTYTNSGLGYAATTDGSGVNATFNVVVAAGTLVPSLVLNSAGSGYAVGDTIVIAESTDFSDAATGTLDSTVATISPETNTSTAKLYVTASIANGSGADVIAVKAQTNLAGGTAGAIHKAGEVVSTDSVTGMTGQYVVGGANGTGTIVGILAEPVDARTTEQTGAVVVNGPAVAVYNNLILPATAVEATVKAALLALSPSIKTQ